MQWSIEPIRLELKYTWKISRNASDYKINFIVSVRDGEHEGRGEVAPNIRYNETADSIAAAFQTFMSHNNDAPRDARELAAHIKALNLPNALRFGIESAYVHLQCKLQGISLAQFLGIPQSEAVHTCYTLPIMDVSKIEAFYQANHLERFRYIKLKVNAETAYEEITTLLSFCRQPVMIDANEAWKDPDALLKLFEKLRGSNIEFFEQPLPAGLNHEYIYLKKHAQFPLMADESICDEADFTLLQQQFHGVNMKLMKAAGYLNGLRILQEGKKCGMKTMVGCMVETTLGMSGAFAMCALSDYADLDGYMIIKDEPFRMLEEKRGEVTAAQ
jgi:L-alanine-DL-glutamate epimerase-like enolase superfamily enzyme